ncbi:hypothetical protein JHK82_039410 [Glycine max]|uniref:Uncharacterized protein n=1 Tax=Glycine max TaxID=3847 RepID=A0A0R0GBG2_SOYBN|nr:hypothetical protein JHK87_039384 [Glycine soja]KAG5110187.1 hypothetical protein JHK82_039410 [Glycine max]KAG5121475.1 hypothetical protein JHK84_039815 [Glycine max]KRH15694.1 hypothetical protein GLYMA_14G104700v4 [Glycine max]
MMAFYGIVGLFSIFYFGSIIYLGYSTFESIIYPETIEHGFIPLTCIEDNLNGTQIAHKADKLSCISFSFKKSLESWFIDWWNIRQSKIFLNDIKEKRFHSTHGWELVIGFVYKDFGFAQNDQIIFGLVSTSPVILDTILKYLIFHYLNRASPSLVVIYPSMND